MGRGKRLGNAPCHRPTSCPQPFAGWMTCVLLATPGASVAKWYGPAQSSVKPTAESRLGSFGDRGNGRYREELRKALAAITRYLTAHQFLPECTLLHIFGQYGTGAVLADLAGFADVPCGKEYTALDHPQVQARLHLPPDQFQQREDKSSGALPLRLPRGAGGAQEHTVPCGGGDPSSRQEEESCWRHA